MASIGNLIHETSTTTGTGDFTTAVVNGKQPFSTAFGTGGTTNVFYYFISNQSAIEWEMGTGHMSNTTTLVRDTVIASTNANAAVNFTAGIKDVTNDMPSLVTVDNALVRFDGITGAIQGSSISVSDAGAMSNVASINFGGSTLSAYDETSWTPVVTFVTSGNLSVAYSAQVGRYIRVGKMVSASFSITTSSFAFTTSTGSLLVTGLPAASTASGYFSVGAVNSQGINMGTAYINAQITANDAQLYITQTLLNGTNLGAIGVGNGVTSGTNIVLRGSITYLSQ